MRYVFFLLLALLAVHAGFEQGQRIGDSSVPASLAANSYAPVFMPSADYPARYGAEPDTTSPWRYFPLEIGDQWQYEHFHPKTGDISYEDCQVRTDTLLEGHTYYALRYCFNDGQLRTSSQSDTYVRFDTTNALVIERVVISGQPHERWWD